MHKIGQPVRFLGRPLGPLLTNGLSLMKKVLRTLAISALISLSLASAAPATDAAVYKKEFESGVTTLIISIEEMNDIMKIVKSLEESLEQKL